MPRCEECSRDFSTDAALAQHNSDKHGSVSKHEMKQAKRQEREAQQKTEQGKASRKKRMKTITIIAAVVLAVIALAAFVAYLPKKETAGTQIGPVGSTHQHADFRLYILGEQLDFTSPRYQVRAREVHIEGGDDDVIHKHATGVTVGHFFTTLGFRTNSTCIVTDGSGQYCSSEGATLKYFLKKEGKEWEQVNDLSNYEIRDLDKYLITYGNETDLTAQQESVTDKSRIESGRGTGMPVPA